MVKPFHIFVVSGSEDDRTYSAECPGISDVCRMWVACTACPPLERESDADDDMWDCDGIAHGVKHRRFSDGWLVPSQDRCFVRDNDYLPDAACYVAAEVLEGRYRVDFDVEDETDLILFLNEPEPAAA